MHFRQDAKSLKVIIAVPFSSLQEFNTVSKHFAIVPSGQCFAVRASSKTYSSLKQLSGPFPQFFKVILPLENIPLIVG